jgi:hypothetical protein
VKEIMSRPGTDIGEAMKGVKDLSSRANRQKLTALLGSKDANAMLDQVDEMKTAFEIQAALSRNSDTAVNQAVQGSIDQSTSPGVLKTLMQGKPLDASKRLAQVFTGATPEAQAAQKAGIYSEIAQALTTIRGPSAEHALAAINAASRGQTMNEAQAKKIANLTAALLAGSGYQTGTQLRQSRTPY